MQFETAILSKMSVDDLKRLVKTGEGKYLEFKRTVPSVYKISREISAFANTRGGTIIVGVDDNHSILGVDAYHEEEFLIYEAAHELCKPAVPVKIEVLPTENRDILIIFVPEAIEKPVYITNKNRREVYLRRADESIIATRQQAEIMRNKYGETGVSFEYGPNERKLFQYLNEYERITVNEFSHLINVTTYRASKILVNLVSAGVLKLLNHRNIDYYLFSNECS